ncbi:MAG: PepSY domain-containing protein [Roseovarius sp.]|nr:PepSY domain-containing protein [Roseovarius sp.]
MKTVKLAATALAVAAGLAASGVKASDDEDRQMKKTPPRAEWMRVAELAQQLEAQGYTIHEIDTEYGVYEVEMTDAQGMRVDAYLDPVTGKPVQRRGDDD